MRHFFGSFAVLALGFGLSACSDDVRLTSERSSLVLGYRCDRPVVQAGTPAEQQLVKEYATLVAQDARNNNRVQLLDPLLSAYAAEDYRSLETRVVAYMCEYGDVRAAVNAAKRPPVFPEPGSAALPFELPLLALQEGTGAPSVSATKRFSLEEHRGKIVVLNFWSTWCSPCVEKHPELVRIAEQYQDEGVVVYGIIFEDSPAKVARWLKEHGGESEYRMLVDEGNKVGRLYRVTGIPRTFIIGRDGRIAQGTWGHFAGLEEKLQHLLRKPA